MTQPTTVDNLRADVNGPLHILNDQLNYLVYAIGVAIEKDPNQASGYWLRQARKQARTMSTLLGKLGSDLNAAKIQEEGQAAVEAQARQDASWVLPAAEAARVARAEGKA